MSNNDIFWLRLEALLERNRIVIDRPRGSHHPRFPEIVYTLDYGYLDGTSSNDGEGVDVWLGSEPERGLDAVICTVDLDRGDAEMKLMVGCTEQEKAYVERFYNEWPDMGAKIIKRSK
jgi:inorganic pyrophosphatase